MNEHKIEVDPRELADMISAELINCGGSNEQNWCLLGKRTMPLWPRPSMESRLPGAHG